MGCFRFLLAASVMLSHFAFYPAAFPHPLPGDVAVEAFYIISGFLITLVLHGKYKDSRFTFYTNRALRIYPIYWVCLALYLVADALVFAGYFPKAPAWGAPYYVDTSSLWWWDQNGSRLDATDVLAAASANLGILGHDILTFLNEDRTFHATGIDLFYHKLLAIKVAWTISIELMFYVIAPFIVRKLWLVCAVLCVSLALQLQTYVVSPLSTDWFSRIFPFALAYFMAGSLAYRAYLWLISRAYNGSVRRAVNLYMLGSCLTLLLLTAFFDHLPLGRAIYLTATTLCLPGIVIAGQRIPIDGFLGDLSYPVYLVHPIFMIVIIVGSNPIGIAAESFPIAASLLVSVTLVYFVERPIDRYRQRRVREGGSSMASITWAPRYACNTPAGSDEKCVSRTPF